MDPRLNRLQVEIATVLTGLSPKQLCAHPPGKWCVTEILEHLYLTYTGTTKGFERVLKAGTPKVTPPTLKQRSAVLLVLGFSFLPSGREAPAMARPRGLAPGTVQKEIGSKIAEMDAILAACEGKFGANTKVLDHPILGPLTIGQWRKFHLVHGRHHLKQIQRLSTHC